MKDASDPSSTGRDPEISDTIRELTGRLGVGQIHSHEDRESVRRDWEAIGESSCVYDCYAAYSLYEWLNDQGVIKIEGPTPATRLDDVLSSSDSRFAGFRFFARRFDPLPFVHRLILFETVYVNLYGFYADNSDLGRLTSYGLFRQYPNPTGPELLGIYRLEKAQVLAGMSLVFETIPDLPSYDRLFKDPEVARCFGSYAGLLSWLYDEESKARCGLASQEMGLLELVHDRYYEFAGVVLDFLETALIFRGSQLAGSAPMASTMAGSLPPLNLPLGSLTQSPSRDALGLYQVASDSVLGMSVAVSSFADVLRLREDKRIGKIRALLMQYVQAADSSDEQVVKEIEAEIAVAKRALDQLKWRESPTYMFLVRPLAYVPGVGQAISLLNDALDVAQHLRVRKHGWIYFGSK